MPGGRIIDEVKKLRAEARGRLADPAFEKLVAEENEARERMIESLKESRKNR